MRRLCVLALVGGSLALGGCVAAIAPVAAGGLIGHSRLKGHHPRRKHDAPPAAPATATPVTVVPLPADPNAMQVGTLYRGQLPTPVGAAQTAAPTPAAPAQPDKGGWRDVVHYVAAAALDTPDRSVLLAKGSTAAAPIWVPCEGKPLAVVIDLDAVGASDPSGPAVSSIGAIETMGLTPVYISSRDAAGARTQAKALAGRVMAAPVEDRTLFAMTPGTEAAVRAAIAARYCAVALVGTRAADFPNAMLPSAVGANRGWFLLPASRTNGN